MVLVPGGGLTWAVLGGMTVGSGPATPGDAPRLYPLAVLSDCVVCPSPGASPLDFLPYAASGKPLMGGFRLGPTPGLAKLEGVQEMAWAVDPMERGLNPARHIKGGDAVLDDGE